jgi:hypothetical protein
VPDRADLRIALIASLALPLSVLAALDISHLHKRTLITVFGLAAAFVVARRPWGSFAVAAPAFLLPDVRTQYSVPGRLQLAILTFILAAWYWEKMGRPRASRPALATAAFFSVALVTINIANRASVDDALWPALIAFAGVLFGTTLSVTREGRTALAYASLPLAALAFAEILGLHNPWPALVHSTTFLNLSEEAGALRGQSTFGQPLIAGGCLAAMAALALQSESRWATGLAVLISGGALATVSRSAIIGIAAALTMSVLVGPLRQRRLLVCSAAAICGVLLVTLVPSLRASFSARTSNPLYTDQTVRDYGITELKHDWQTNTAELLFGGGTPTVSDKLESIGGVTGYYIFDDQYITSVYDLGLIPLAVLAVLILTALMRASPRALRLGLPAMTVVAVIMFFTDGLDWLSLGFVAWLTLGLASSGAPEDLPPRSETKPFRSPRSRVPSQRAIARP